MSFNTPGGERGRSLGFRRAGQVFDTGRWPRRGLAAWKISKKKKNVYLLELFEPEVLFDALWTTNVMSSNCNPGTMMSTRSMLLRIVVESRVLLYGAKKLSLK